MPDRLLDYSPAVGMAAVLAPQNSARPAGSSQKNLHRLPVFLEEGLAAGFWPEAEVAPADQNCLIRSPHGRGPGEGKPDA